MIGSLTMTRRPVPFLVPRVCTILKVAFLGLAVCFSAPHFAYPQSTSSADLNQLKSQAKQAKAKGLVDQEASLLCQAATQDPAHFQKHCDDARSEAARLLGDFDGYLGTGKFEFSHRDYPGAIRDLSRITFGPHATEAQRIIQQAHVIQAAGGLDAMSAKALHDAQIAYEQGDFSAASAAAQSVQTSDLGPSAQQILHNIQLYRDTMALGDSLAAAGNMKAAQEKYAFALQIKANGPGDPAGRLAGVNAAIAAQQQQKVSAEQASTPSTAPSPATQPDPRSARLLVRATREEKQNNLQAALSAYAAILARDPADKAAYEGKRRVQARLQHNAQSSATVTEEPVASDDAPSGALLASAIEAFYSGHFASAAEQFRSYLGTDTIHNQGAAHFYLAASLVSQTYLAAPDASPRLLNSDVGEQFRLASRAGYHPLPSLVSPRILSAWKESGAAQ